MSGFPLAALHRAARDRPPPGPAVERCDMCAAELDGGHRHLVDLLDRRIMCACHPCRLLFADDHTHQRYRAVPDRHLRLAGPVLDGRAWDELQIPVGLAFLFHNSAREQPVACYPGPAGATESDLDPGAWDRITAAHPVLATLRPDVEALLVRRGADAYLVPIDACYELTGRLRTRWRGFDGGQEAHAEVDAFFARIDGLSRPERRTP
ncbi:DUF5947 family protein [Actinoplanes regularis]|uniref:Uncharacterized protein n=1 Tax=Actinoplanes regularis TaxID=52697 RepID=A0A239F9B5_9ACTN|nr:DUF5947 family protein [Actinoplanes regularis]GIE90026.1 hypothetical protein Are01nite_65060 [Actinoplanes regularis]SNS53078.1 hypothetical protein SAMN06264365_117136 [Actinoplanes regularis]